GERWIRRDCWDERIKGETCQKGRPGARHCSSTNLDDVGLGRQCDTERTPELVVIGRILYYYVGKREPELGGSRVCRTDRAFLPRVGLTSHPGSVISNPPCGGDRLSKDLQILSLRLR